MHKVKKAYNDCNNCIVLASDKGFAPCMATMIKSIIEHSNVENYYDILVLHKDIDDVTQMQICELSNSHKNISIRFINMIDYLEGHLFYTENRDAITEETYFRLFIPWILETAYEKALYLDGDMIARNDVNEIISIDIDDYLVAGVRDYWGICNCYIEGDKRRAYRESIGLDNIDEYIIGALILFNLNNFRNEYTLEYVLKLSTSFEWLQHDQDVINTLIKNNTKLISPSYAFMEDYGNNKFLPTP